MNNVRQIALAYLNYESAFQNFPEEGYEPPAYLPYTIAMGGTDIWVDSKHFQVLPYIEQQNLYDAWVEACVATGNTEMYLEEIDYVAYPNLVAPETFHCPSMIPPVELVYSQWLSPAAPANGYIDYNPVDGDWSIDSSGDWFFDEGFGAIEKIGEISDGTSNSLCFGEQFGEGSAIPAARQYTWGLAYHAGASTGDAYDYRH